MRAHSPEKGFTLIELLVVISIIGLLSSIVLASLSSARKKAKDAYIISEAEQFRTLLEENAVDYGDYGNIQPHQWFGGPNGTACAIANFSGTYAAQAIALCNAVVNANPNMPVQGELYMGEQTWNPLKYSIMAALPSKGTYVCMGSNGKSSTIDLGSWGSPGCYADPSL